MTKQRLLLFILFLITIPAPVTFFILLDVAQGEDEPTGLVVTGPGQRYTENIPVFDVHGFGYQPAVLPGALDTTSATVIEQGGGSDPNNPYAVIRKNGPTFLHPGATAHYEIVLANYESVTHAYQLTDTLPQQLDYVPDSATGLAYDPATRTLTWQGELSPGHLDYIIEESNLALPYLDLADFGAVNLCDDFIANGEACDDVSVTFNLGVNGYTTNLYGEVLGQLTVSSNGLILASDTAVPNPYSHNQWLPDETTPGFVLAGLWRDIDMGGDTPQNGRFHAAIISGLIEGQDVFYAQWHDASQAGDPDLTARHAIALLLNGDDSAAAGSAQDMADHAFFIYDNISDPAQLVDQGYTIGIADKLGARGVTYAYAPCCGDTRPPQGYPPPAGTTLHLRPVLFGAENEYSRTFNYEVVVNEPVPENVSALANLLAPCNWWERVRARR